MTGIGGPGGIGGPKGPGGPTGPGGPDDVTDVSDAAHVSDAGHIADVGHVDATAAAAGTKAAGGIEAMAAEIAAGKLTAHEAIDRLVNEIAGTDQLGAAERAELKEMLTDLVANDPYLQSLVGRI